MGGAISNTSIILAGCVCVWYDSDAPDVFGDAARRLQRVPHRHESDEAGAAAAALRHGLLGVASDCCYCALHDQGLIGMGCRQLCLIGYWCHHHDADQLDLMPSWLTTHALLSLRCVYSESASALLNFNFTT